MAAVMLLLGCSATKRIPNGQYMLVKNQVGEDKDVPKKQRIRAADVEKYIRPETNRKFLGTNLYIHLHNLASADTTKKNWINRTLRNWGDAAVLLDSTAVERSAGMIHEYAQFVGYYNSEVGFDVETRRKRAKVTYHIRQGDPYRIGNISYRFHDDLLRQVVMEDSAATLLHPGEILDGNVLVDEKERITTYLRDNGFYDFNQSYIKYMADPTQDPDIFDVEVEFQQKVVDYNSLGEAVYDNTSVYRISEIFINPQYDPMKAAAEEGYYQRMDTMEYRGLKVIYPHGGRPKVKASILRQVVNLYPNHIYDETEVRQTQINLMRLGNYRSAHIIFEPVETDQDMIVTFVGGEEEDQSVEYVTEKYLKCHINCTPALRQSYKIELEGTTASSFNAIRATVGYQNRNFFRGAELFDVSFTGGYEFLRSAGRSGAFELGGAASITFPRFITPLRVDRYNKMVNPRSKAEISVNAQSRVVYERTLVSATWGYAWSNRGRSTFALRPIDLNFVKLSSLDAEWIDKQKNAYLIHSFDDQLVSGMSGSYIYNTQVAVPGRRHGSFVFRLNWETAGNLLDGGTSLFAKKHTDRESGERYYRIFGIRYAQYFRFDASISDRIALGGKTNIAFRLYGGMGKAYGNAVAMPFDRLFYAGGSNSMRGWLPRRLGPGNEEIEDDTYPNQAADMKLEANLELRFPVWKMLQGAVFFDLGNIWFMKKSGQAEESVFKINRFYRQLGFNTGLGLRFDVNVVVIRFDLGYRLHDPNRPKGERWQDKFKLGRTVINFGVGYPF
ncbi:MAG: sorting and assembly machinery component 50 [Rikenellaceae bacterium]|nr:sorting and assembly machinery component 50 [Rikenellaceae bacterium]